MSGILLLSRGGEHKIYGIFSCMWFTQHVDKGRRRWLGWVLSQEHAPWVWRWIKYGKNDPKPGDRFNPRCGENTWTQWAGMKVHNIFTWLLSILYEGDNPKVGHLWLQGEMILQTKNRVLLKPCFLTPHTHPGRLLAPSILWWPYLPGAVCFAGGVNLLRNLGAAQRCSRPPPCHSQPFSTNPGAIDLPSESPCFFSTPRTTFWAPLTLTGSLKLPSNGPSNPQPRLLPPTHHVAIRDQPNVRSDPAIYVWCPSERSHHPGGQAQSLSTGDRARKTQPPLTSSASSHPSPPSPALTPCTRLSELLMDPEAHGLWWLGTSSGTWLFHVIGSCASLPTTPHPTPAITTTLICTHIHPFLHRIFPAYPGFILISCQCF